MYNTSVFSWVMMTKPLIKLHLGEVMFDIRDFAIDTMISIIAVIEIAILIKFKYLRLQYIRPHMHIVFYSFFMLGFYNQL